MTQTPQPPGLQPERTRLAWQRTAIALAIGALVYARVEAAALSWVGWFLALAGAAVAIWIGIRSSHRYRHALRQVEAKGQLADGVLPLVTSLVVTVAGLTVVLVTIITAVRP